ncbi:ATP-grasp domain-containing protein [Rivularia sp. IAM M-261]|nr:ATP-grasp domain-containing protein [Calothrix sp. PCC 7716]GJD15449.1 ATP-grasp domain-containing protein [Rivularia sp. IAM M-261]
MRGMDLLEYQVKEWFGQIGIPVLPSQRIDHPTDLKRLKIPYPIVLKSQVSGGARLKVGGVRFVETTIDAIAAAQNIFNLPIMGELPEVLLAEAKYDAEQELYLAVVIDTAVCRPILLGCQEPDIDLDSYGDKMQHVVVEHEFSSFYARRLALKMGLQGKRMQTVSSVIEKMYYLLVEKDLDLVEINPLGINSQGEAMALNGSISVNERAISRHPDIALMATKMHNRYNGNGKNQDLKDWEGLELHGKIGIMGNGAGSVLTTMDLVSLAGGKPGFCLNLRHASPLDASPTTFKTRLEKALSIMSADKSIQVILINLLGSIPQAIEIAEVITEFVHHYNNEHKSNGTRNGNKHKRDHNFPRLVVRLAGSDLDGAKKELTALKHESDMSIVMTESLDEAVSEAVRLTQPLVYKK